MEASQTGQQVNNVPLVPVPMSIGQEKPFPNFDTKMMSSFLHPSPDSSEVYFYMFMPVWLPSHLQAWAAD